MKRILLIDRDTANRGILGSRLTDCGFDVHVAPSAEIGMEEGLRGGHDLVLIADRPDGEDAGARTCHALASHAALADTPVLVFATAEIPAETARTAYDAGARRYVFLDEMPSIERIVATHLRGKERIDVLRERYRQARREHEHLSGAAGSASTCAESASASAYPDALLLVDTLGIVRWSDRGAAAIFGPGLEGLHLRDVAPNSGLVRFVRSARSVSLEGLRFDLSPDRGRPTRDLVASAYPTRDRAGAAFWVVLVNDVGKRRIAEHMIGGQTREVPASMASPLIDAARRRFGPERIVGSGPAVDELRRQVGEHADSRTPVLLVGESGSGRSFLARVIHYAARVPGPLVELRCGALSADTQERELFGPAPGDGEPGTSGLAHAADRGTLFLSEIDRLAPHLQARLAETIRTGVDRDPATGESVSLDLRILAATAVDLDRLASSGGFSAQLAGHLGVHRLQLEPLRERVGEIPSIVHSLLRHSGVPDVSNQAMRALQAHAWPRNLDELEEVLDAAAHRCDGEQIEVHHLPWAPAASAPEQVVTRSAGMRRPPARVLVRPALGGSASPWDIRSDEPVSFDLYEKKAILRALHRCGGDRLAAADLLRIGKSTLYRKIKRFGIR